MEEGKYPIIVIGAGAGGLVVAIGAARAGKKVLLVEKGRYGGDCTNFGCVPSKSLIAAAEAAHMQREGHLLGLEGSTPFTSAVKALERVRAIVAKIRAHEEPPALEKLGVETLTGTASFLDPHRLKISMGEKEVVVEGKQIVLATGSGPMIPSIPGLEGTPYLTNETIFDLEKIPKSLCVLGGGPIGCEMAQAFARLGSRVALVHRREVLLKKEELEAARVIAETFRKEGIELRLGAEPKSVAFAGGQFTLAFDGADDLKADALLVSVGRKAHLDSLNLSAAGVEATPRGIPVDRYCRTNVHHIWAIGDATGGAQFTHYAENQARAVLTSLLLPFKKKQSKQPVPRVTFTDPEVASIGLLQSEAEERYGKNKVVAYNVPLTQVDRAITADRTEGFVKVVTKKLSSKILGATIVAPRAGEMLGEISTAMYGKMPLRKLANIIHPYPAYTLGIRRAGDFWLTQTFLPWLKGLPKAFSWKRLIPLFVILAAMVIVYVTGVYKYISFTMLQERHAQLKGFVNAHPILTPIGYILLYAISTSLSLPGGAILSLVGGFLFPIPWSTLCVLVGATIGASAIFLAAKYAIGDFLRKKAGPFLKKMEKGFQQNAWSYLLFLRFVPLFPFWLVNIAPAFFGVGYVTYLWTTFVGIAPGAYVYTQAGAGLSAIFETGEKFSLASILNIQLRIALIALGLFALIPIFVKKYLARKKRK